MLGFSADARAFFNDVLQDGVLKRYIGIHSLELGVLLQGLQSLVIGGFQTTILRFPVVLRGIGDAMPAADILDHPVAFDLIEDLDNLVLAEFRSSHFRFSVVNYYYPQEPLKISGPILGEVYSGYYGRQLRGCPFDSRIGPHHHLYATTSHPSRSSTF